MNHEDDHDEVGWMSQGACVEHPDPDMWFPGRGERATGARLVCETCPVQAPCAIYAIERREAYGVWGGLSEYQRRKLREATESDGSKASGGRGELVLSASAQV